MLPGCWQDQEMRTAEGMLPAQCTATISSCQQYAGVQVPAVHSYGSFFALLHKMLVSYTASSALETRALTA